jgi:hypothetical protein
MRVLSAFHAMMSNAGRALAQQPVQHHVVEDQVVGPQLVERRCHPGAVEHACAGHLPFQPGHGLLVGEDAEHARLAVVEQRVQQRDRADPVVAGAGQIRGGHRGQRAAEAQPDDVYLVRAGDVGDHVDRRARAADEVVVQRDVPLTRVRVAVADREHRAVVLDRPLQEAAPGREVPSRSTC